MEPQNATPVQPSMQTPETAKHGMGPVIGAVIIILILVLGALYFWGVKAQKDAEVLPFIPQEMTGETSVQGNQDLSTADDISSLQKDTDDAYMAQLEADIEADLRAIENL